MRILFLGDIVGKPGVAFLKRALPLLVPREQIDVVIANAENATDGSGLSPKDYRRIREAGVDLVTLGDHVYKKKDIIPTLEQDERICRPANFPTSAPGRDYASCISRGGSAVAAFSLLGRTYMRPAECPYQAAERILQALAGRVPHQSVIGSGNSSLGGAGPCSASARLSRAARKGIRGACHSPGESGCREIESA